MIFPVLSYFDSQIGPRVFLTPPELRNSMYLNHILALMDLNEVSFFVHEYGSIKTANLFFEIWSPLARGKTELMMLSLVCFDEEYNLSSFKEIMEYFVKEIKSIPDIYKAFHYKSSIMSGAKEKFQEIVNFFHSFYQSLPELFKQNSSKILMYGLSQSAKNLIIKSLQENVLQSKQNAEKPFLL